MKKQSKGFMPLLCGAYQAEGNSEKFPVMLNLFQHLSNCKYQAGQSAENGLNPSPMPPLPLRERGNKGAALAERICRGRLNPSPLAKFRTADKPVSESRNHGSGSEVMTGASAKEFQDAGEGSGVRGNNGFTLAEVLITLVIIGVIGALTVPALIQNTKKQEYVTALKKAYSTLSQAAQQIIAEEGSPNCSAGGWLCSIQDNFDMFKKYLNSAKECTSASGCFQHGIKYLNTGVWTTYQTGENYKRLILADGMQVLFDGINTSCAGDNPAVWGVKNYCAIIAVDINGEKAPNQMGRDLFYFIVKENGLYPAGCDYDTHDCVPGAETRGHGCACRVIRENAINY